ncbi:MAG: FKBP-type peptidyl-prolyl cis-trans isomerase, partial [Nanoarchaeota archaeon]
MGVKKGDTVKVHYRGTLDDGTVFDSSRSREPLEFEVGAGQMIKGFDQGVLGMEAGQKKDITLAPADSYGDPNPQMVQTVPKDKIPAADL